ncbi:MAG TPA: hypothetical protein VI603_01130 [Saprospiraceae bacterium]|nr:hypothetical protein [Saprospiraceae bacterium]
MHTSIIRHAELELDTLEIEFAISFARELTFMEQTVMTDRFIEIIEEHAVYWGGGIGSTSLQGCLDLSKSKLSIEEGMRLIENFVSGYYNLVQEIVMKSLPDNCKFEK